MLQLFYQVEGDMCLKIIENGNHKDIFIREGEVNICLLLYVCVAHACECLSYDCNKSFK